MVAVRRVHVDDIPRGGRVNGKRMAALSSLPSIQDPDFWRSWPGSKSEKGVDKPYENHPWVYAATIALARAISGMPFRIYRGKRPRFRCAKTDIARYVRDRVRASGANQEDKQPVSDDHPLVELFDDPCPALTYSQLWQATIIHLIASAGENFWVMLGKNGERRKEGEIPKEIWPQDPRSFQPIKNDGSVGIDLRTRMPAGWKVQGIAPFKLHELVHFNWFHPSEPHRGLSPLTPGQVSLDSNYAAGEFNRQFFRRGCHPGGIFEHPKSLTAPQRKDFLDAVAEDNEGLERAHETMLLENGIRFSWNPRTHRDMEFKQLMDMSRDEILAVIGTMKSVLAITDEINYATFLGQKRIWIENQVLPTAFDFEDVLYSQLFKSIEGGVYWGEFDLSGVAALQDDLQSKVTTGKVMFDMGWSRDEVGARLDFGMKPDPATDVRGGPDSFGAGVDTEEGGETEATPVAGQGAQASAAAALAAGGSVQDTALNGAQIASLVDIAAKVQANELEGPTAIAIIKAAFPTIDDAEAQAIINPATKAAGDKPNTETPAAPGQGNETKTTEDSGNANAAGGVPQPPPIADHKKTPHGSVVPWFADLEVRLADWDLVHAGQLSLSFRTDLIGEDLAREWHHRVTLPLREVVAKSVRKYFGRLEESQVEKFQKYIRDLGGKALTEKDIDRILFNVREWDRELRKVLGPEMKKVQGIAAKRLSKELKLPAIKVTNPSMLRIHAKKLGMLIEVPKYTRKVVRSKLIEGLSKNESVDDLRIRLRSTFEGIGGNSRALRVARTEVQMMQQATRQEAMKESGVKSRKWVSVLGPATRDDHRDEHGHVAGIDKRFPVTKLLHPGEFGAPVEQIVNCDCDVLPQVEI